MNSARAANIFGSLLAILFCAGCQTFNTTDEQFQKQQFGKYDACPKADAAWTYSAPMIEMLMTFVACRP
jgi:hypothetical protein